MRIWITLTLSHSINPWNADVNYSRHSVFLLATV